MPPTGLVFYLADPKTNAPSYIGVTTVTATDERDRLVKEARRNGPEPVHRWIRSLRTTPLLMTLPRVNAPVDEQLALWHTIYGALDLLSRPPEVTAPAKLVAKFEEWVDVERRHYAPLKPPGERRTRHPGKPKPKPKPDPEPETQLEPKQQAARKRTTILRCSGENCDFLAKQLIMRRHQATYPHEGTTVVYEDEVSTIRDYERQHATRKAERKSSSSAIPSHEIRECGECDFIGKQGRLRTHLKETGHGGETRLPQTAELVARHAKLTMPESGLARCKECGKLGKKQVIRNHHRITGHDGLTIIMADDESTIAEYEATAKRGRNDARYRCGECEMVTVSGSLARHQKKTGHVGRTRVKT